MLHLRCFTFECEKCVDFDRWKCCGRIRFGLSNLKICEIFEEISFKNTRIRSKTSICLKQSKSIKQSFRQNHFKSRVQRNSQIWYVFSVRVPNAKLVHAHVGDCDVSKHDRSGPSDSAHRSCDQTNKLSRVEFNDSEQSAAEQRQRGDFGYQRTA